MEIVEKDIWDQVIEYLPLIETMAHIYSDKVHGYSFLEYDDLYQEACIIVYQKVSSYDSNRGRTLENYLIMQIRYRFFDLINMSKFVVYVPLCYAKEAYRISKIQEEHRIATGEYLSIEELEKRISNLSPTTIQSLGFLNRTMGRSITTSLSEFVEIPIDCISEDDIDVNMELREKHCEESLLYHAGIEEDIIFSDLRKDMYQKLDHLNQKQRETILYHLGFITGKQELFREIVERFGGTKQNAQKHYKKGIKKLQKVMLDEWN